MKRNDQEGTDDLRYTVIGAVESDLKALAKMDPKARLKAGESEIARVREAASSLVKMDLMLKAEEYRNGLIALVPTIESDIKQDISEDEAA